MRRVRLYAVIDTHLDESELDAELLAAEAALAHRGVVVQFRSEATGYAGEFASLGADASSWPGPLPVDRPRALPVDRIKLSKRARERLEKCGRGETIRVRQGDDLLIGGFITFSWNGGKGGYEITERGRSALQWWTDKRRAAETVQALSTIGDEIGPCTEGGE